MQLHLLQFANRPFSQIEPDLFLTFASKKQELTRQMESQEETPIRNGEDKRQTQRALCSPFGESNGEQEKGGETDEDMVVDGGMEDWNGFISGGTALTEAGEGEVVAEWRPGEPVTPQHVLSLNSYTEGESALFKQSQITPILSEQKLTVVFLLPPCLGQYLALNKYCWF